MTGFPRAFCRSVLGPFRLRQAERGGGPRWFSALQSDRHSFQPRPSPPAWLRPRPAIAVGRACYFFSTSLRCERRHRRKKGDDAVFDPNTLKDAWAPGPEDWDNPTNWRMPYPSLARKPELPKEAPLPPVYQYLTPKLNILFCGSDAFSCQSLQALYDEMLRQQLEESYQTPPPNNIPRPGRIESIHVVVRPPKPQGRGLTALPSPVQRLAESLNLPVHVLDTFTNYHPPKHNLIIAVSFGLFVPQRLLKGAAYGGLNVHPSFLPDLHGAAPIEHAFLLGRRYTGVTVQTLHETKFDGGRVLRVSQPVELVSRSAGAASPTAIANATELYKVLAPMGAKILVQTLRLGLYLHEATLRRITERGWGRAMEEEADSKERYKRFVAGGQPLMAVREMNPPPPEKFVGVVAAAAVDGEAPVPMIAAAAGLGWKSNDGENDAMPHPLALRRDAVTPAAAPKLTKADFEVPWRPWPKKPEQKDEPEVRGKEKEAAAPPSPTTAFDVDRRARALGRLWTHVPQVQKKKQALAAVVPPPVRILFDDIDVVPCPPALQAALAAAHRTAQVVDKEAGNKDDTTRKSDLQGVWIATFKQTIRDEAQDTTRDTVPEQPQEVKGQGTPRAEESLLGAATEETPPPPPPKTPPRTPTRFFDVTLPYFVDPADGSGAILLPLGMPSKPSATETAVNCLRIGQILVSGDAIKPAASALRVFARYLDQLEPKDQKAAFGRVSWDVVYRQ